MFSQQIEWYQGSSSGRRVHPCPGWRTRFVPAGERCPSRCSALPSTILPRSIPRVRFVATGTEASPAQTAMEDADRDGDVELVLRFRIQELGLVYGNTFAVLTG